MRPLLNNKGSVIFIDQRPKMIVHYAHGQHGVSVKEPEIDLKSLATSR